MEPAALATAYSALRPTLDKLSEYTRARLRAELAPRKPLVIDPRVKHLSSICEKLQTGLFNSMLELEDLVGTKVVVLRRSEIEPVAEIIKEAFQFVREKERIVEPTEFRYRERHVIVRPPKDFLERNPDLAELVVEIQITSVVQHALDQATHGFDYKGLTVDWARYRLVAGLRATLELVDNLLDNMETSATLMEQTVGFPEELLFQSDVLQGLMDAFDEDSLPLNRRRLTETVSSWLTSLDLQPQHLRDLLERHQDLVSATSLSAIDAVLGSLLREHGAQLVARHEGLLFISTELATLVAEASLVPGDRRVRLE